MCACVRVSMHECYKCVENAAGVIILNLQHTAVCRAMSIIMQQCVGLLPYVGQLYCGCGGFELIAHLPMYNLVGPYQLQ